MRRFSIAMACFSLVWTVFSTTMAFLALLLIGDRARLLFFVVLAANSFMVGVNMITLTLGSPGHDTLHYPRRFTQWIAGLAQQCFGRIPAAWTWLRQFHQGRKDLAADMARPTRRAWDALANPAHGITTARQSRIEKLRMRSDIVVDRLSGSLDVADMDAMILLDKTLGEVADAYSRSLAVSTTDKARRDIDKLVDKTLDQMIAAAETRLQAASTSVEQHLDTVLRHAQDSSRRLLDG